MFSLTFSFRTLLFLRRHVRLLEQPQKTRPAQRARPAFAKDIHDDTHRPKKTSRQIAVLSGNFSPAGHGAAAGPGKAGEDVGRKNFPSMPRQS